MENESQILGIELFFDLGDFSFKFREIVNFGNIGFIGKGDRVDLIAEFLGNTAVVGFVF